MRALREHGKAAIAVYTLLTALTWAVLLVVFGVTGAAIGAAYIASKITQPFRIGATMALAPWASRRYQRLRRSQGLTASH